ncbi:MAG TPA: hypothetical protein VNT23_07720 [Gaiellaceae bacterium]|nr:hypothetical protein [Gaiellaceae bacterium]
MLRRRDTSRRQARELARLLAALDALGSERRVAPPRRRPRLLVGRAG